MPRLVRFMTSYYPRRLVSGGRELHAFGEQLSCHLLSHRTGMRLIGISACLAFLPLSWPDGLRPSAEGRKGSLSRRTWIRRGLIFSVDLFLKKAFLAVP